MADVETAAPPCVFISYAWSSDEHVAWVEKLAMDLVENGVDVVLDRWDLKLGHDVIAFMERIRTDPGIGRVLCVCDQNYAAKADGRSGGVGTEAIIITPEIYASTTQTKFIPIVRTVPGDSQEALPTFLRGRRYLDFSEEAHYETRLDYLLRELHDAPVSRKPALGAVPDYAEGVDSPSPRKEVRRSPKPPRRATAAEFAHLVEQRINDGEIWHYVLTTPQGSRAGFAYPEDNRDLSDGVSLVPNGGPVGIRFPPVKWDQIQSWKSAPADLPENAHLATGNDRPAARVDSAETLRREAEAAKEAYLSMRVRLASYMSPATESDDWTIESVDELGVILRRQAMSLNVPIRFPYALIDWIARDGKSVVLSALGAELYEGQDTVVLVPARSRGR